MPESKRRAAVLAADLVHHPDTDVETRFKATESQVRWIRSDPEVRWLVHSYMRTYGDLGMEVTDEVLATMLVAAEAAFVRDNNRAPREPSPLGEGPAVGRHDPVVYYMRFDATVKIGTTVDIATRRVAVPCQGVMAVEFGGRELEQRRHREFVDSHIHREWFRLDERLGAHIGTVRETFEATERCTTERWLERHR